MSYYSDQNVKTKYLDPRVYVPNSRAVFDLDLSEAAYMPNLKLGFVGLTSSAAASYARGVGAGSIIRSARLVDGKTVLSQLNEAQFYRAFQNQNKKNAHAEVRSSNLDLSSNGRTINGLTNKVARIAVEGLANVNEIGNQTTPTNLATLDLRDYFPILNSIPMLPTGVFPNLSVEIEFNSRLDNQVVTIVTAGTVLNTVRPILIADALINEETVAKMMTRMPKSLVWHEVEHDQFIIPQAAAGVTGNDGGVQNVNIQLNGYNNKVLDELLMIKEIGNAALEVDGNNVLGNGKWSSQACYNQQIQYRVNGRNLLPGEGITGDNSRMAYLVDTYGDCCGYPGSNAYQYNAAELTQVGVAGSGQMDYCGVYVGKYINNLQINYARTNLVQTAGKRATNALLIGHTYGRIRKQFNMVDNGMYVIDYQQM